MTVKNNQLFAKVILDTPFYCYRSIETIKQHFSLQYGEKNEAKQWDLTHRLLQSQKSEVLYIKKFSDPLRHGAKPIPQSGKEWRDVVNTTWDFVERYFILLKKIQDGIMDWP